MYDTHSKLDAFRISKVHSVRHNYTNMAATDPSLSGGRGGGGGSAIDDATTPVIDSSHINPLERRDSLEKHLQTRPDEQDLKNRHILLDTNAAP